MRRTTRYIVVLASVLVAALAATAAVNIAGDPYYLLFYRRAERDSFAARFAVALVASRDGLLYVEQDRPIKRALMATRPADCYAFGSSEGMGLSLRNFPPLREECRSFSNVGATLGGFEDMLAFAGMLAEQHSARQFFIVVSPWFLRRKANTRWTEFAGDVLQGAARLDPSSRWEVLRDLAHVRIETMADAFSIFYLGPSIRSLWRGADPALRIVPVASPGAPSMTEEAVTHPDGSHDFSPSWIAARHLKPIEQATADRAAYSPSMIGRWSAILQSLRRSGIEVTFIIPPYHPELWSCADPAVCQAFDNLENEILRLARRERIRTFGSYDPRRIRLGPDAFIDLNHIDPVWFAAVARVERISPHDLTPVGTLEDK